MGGFHGIGNLRFFFCYHFASTWVVEPVDRGLVPHREPLAVRVDRELDRRVDELAVHVSGALTLLEQPGGEGVTETMRREVAWEGRGLEGPCKRLPDGARIEC